MKLRNKKTGEIVEFNSEHKDSLADFGGKLLVETRTGKEHSYDTLAELNEEWEDYKPSEPLIKDEKIRKAVRAWAEANNITKVWHEGSSAAFRHGAVSIIFNELCWEKIPKGEYAIAELCGEE